MKEYLKRNHYSAVVLLAGAAVFIGGAALQSLIIGGSGVILMLGANFLQIWSMNR
jgi:hypothetical protein